MICVLPLAECGQLGSGWTGCFCCAMGLLVQKVPSHYTPSCRILSRPVPPHPVLSCHPAPGSGEECFSWKDQHPYWYLQRWDVRRGPFPPWGWFLETQVPAMPAPRKGPLCFKQCWRNRVPVSPISLRFHAPSSQSVLWAGARLLPCVGSLQPVWGGWGTMADPTSVPAGGHVDHLSPGWLHPEHTGAAGAGARPALALAPGGPAGVCLPQVPHPLQPW